MHASVNRNKRSLSLDVRTERGRNIFLELGVRSDIVVENFKVGTMARYGLGYEQLKAVKPDVVYVSITGWGQYGPDHTAAGYDPLAQASSGFMSVTGALDGPPTKAGTYLADYPPLRSPLPAFCFFYNTNDICQMALLVRWVGQYDLYLFNEVIGSPLDLSLSLESLYQADCVLHLFKNGRRRRFFSSNPLAHINFVEICKTKS